MEFQDCPLPIDSAASVQLGHGGGGLLSQELIGRLLVPAFGPADGVLLDAAVLAVPGGAIAFTTDSYVVRPLVFPGGDIGSLAVIGTVNDLAMVGARPLWLSLGMILEEGLPMATLEQVVASVQATAERCGVRVVTGDTKVVERGKGDGLYLNTSGIGRIEHQQSIGPAAVRPGDVLLVSGDLGRHGVAILAAREELGFQAPLISDLAPLWPEVDALLTAGLQLHALRDLTRGGLSSALHEIALAAGVAIRVEESAVPIEPSVRGACDLLGLDPLSMANEGRFILILPGQLLEPALALLQEFNSAAAAIGQVAEAGKGSGSVWLKTPLGTSRRLEPDRGDQLPRIC